MIVKSPLNKKYHHKILRSMFIIITTDVLSWIKKNCNEYEVKEISSLIEYLRLKLDNIFNEVE